MYSDLESDYINPVDLCNQLNIVRPFCVIYYMDDFTSYVLSFSRSSYQKMAHMHSSRYFSYFRGNGLRCLSTFL